MDLAQKGEPLEIVSFSLIFNQFLFLHADLKTICKALGGIKTKWFEIGIQLGIPRSKLKEFQEERDPLSAVVSFWLQGNVEESEPLTWKSIAEVLKTEHVGELALSEKIYKEYCKNLRLDVVVHGVVFS